MSALTGTYDRDAEKLLLDGGIEVETSGYRFATPSARVNLAQGRVRGVQPIEGAGPAGTLSADRFEIQDAGDVLRFEGRVRVTVLPPGEGDDPSGRPASGSAERGEILVIAGRRRPGAASRCRIGALAGALVLAGAASAWPQDFHHDSKLPIEITADSLEVLQDDKVATFLGNVDAVQGDLVLNSDQLRVHYRATEAAAATPPARSAGSRPAAMSSCPRPRRPRRATSASTTSTAR